jgi:hypothetical protein
MKKLEVTNPFDHSPIGDGVGGIGHTMHDMTQEKMMLLNGFGTS